MTDEQTAQEKRTLREQAVVRRNALHAELAAVARTALCQAGLDFLQRDNPGSVSGFRPMQSEIDCAALMTRLASQGWTTCLPIVTAMRVPLTFRAWRDGDPLEPGHWDIPVPLATAREVNPDVFLVPLLAFDDEGYRLGYGGGFYDRTLDLARSEREIVAVGIAYSGQKVERVPRNSYDQPLDWILTELGPAPFER